MDNQQKKKCKYCDICGRQLTEQRYLYEYDTQTGKEIYYTRMFCQPTGFLSFLKKSHSEYFYDDVGQQVYTFIW